MNKFTKILFCFLFVVTITVPYSNFIVNYIPRKSISGFGNPKKPQLTFSDYNQGVFQEKFSNWFHRKNGLWGYFVRLNNQFNFKVFNQISGGYNSALLLGKDNFLFQSLYLDDFNKLSRYYDNIHKKKVKKLVKLDSLLNQRGKKLILLLSPNRLLLYPEYVQSKFIIEGRNQRKSDYDKLIELTNSKITVLDTYSFFKNLGPGDLKYFTRTGSHWNKLGACKVTRELLNLIQKNINSTLSNINCDAEFIREKPSKEDQDYIQMANLWNKEFLNIPVYSVKPTVEPSTNQANKNIFIVGTSFMWSILELIKENSLFENFYFYYYFKRRAYNTYNYNESYSDQLSLWKEDLDNSSIVILEANQALFNDLGFDFVNQAIKYLKQDKYS